MLLLKKQAHSILDIKYQKWSLFGHFLLSYKQLTNKINSDIIKILVCQFFDKKIKKRRRKK